MLVVTTPEMAQLDRATMETIGIPGIVLMENAARGAARFFLEALPDLLDRPITVVAGTGNNAGDGFVLARLFSEWGGPVRVLCLKPPEKLKGDALTNFKIIQQLKIPITVWKEGRPFEDQFKTVRESGVLIDAILGTGLKDIVRGHYRQIIEAMNQLQTPVLAVDIPSGLDASSGRPLGAAVKAYATATFGLPKIGQLLSPGEDHVGRLEVIDIGIPRQVLKAAKIQRWYLDEEHVGGLISRRSADVHKGHGGHTAVLAGSPGKTGAAALACLGAARVGTGLVTHLVPTSLNPIMEVKLTEAMTHPIAETESQSVSIKALPELLELLQNKQALAMGPGISLDPETEQLTVELARLVRCPTVLDADALTILSRHLEVFLQNQARLVITPHPGEMARLAQMTTQEVQSQRIETATAFSRAHRITVVLKGHRTVVAAPDGRVAINGSGNPAMASGGMGDVLTGMIAGFLAQGFEPFDAGCLGVYIHGAAADLAVKNKVSRGLIASDLLENVPTVLGRLESRA